MKVKRLSVFLAALAVAALVALSPGTSTAEGDKKVEAIKDTRAVIETKYGEIELKFFPEVAPGHVENFINLANAGSYNGKTFSRVCAGFVAQGGDVPGASQIAWEFSGLLNSGYSIAMARQGDPSGTYKDTASSTFFINLGPNTNLDLYTPPSYYPYVVFGRVADASSKTVVDTIALIPAGPSPNCTPSSPPVITTVTITD